LVKRVEIEQGQVNVVFRIGPGPLVSDPEPTIMHYCGRGDCTFLRGYAENCIGQDHVAQKRGAVAR